MMLFSYVAGFRHTAQRHTLEGGRRVLYWVDPMHPAYRSDHPGTAPDCGMKLEPVYSDAINGSTMSDRPTPVGTIQIGTGMQMAFGISSVPIEKTSGSRTVRLLGQVVPEDTRVYRINAGMEGFVRETFNDSVGTLVKKDQKLATYYGPESLSVASGFLAAVERVPGADGKDGSRTVPFPGAVSKQGVSSIQGYTDRLRNLGMSDPQIKRMAETRQLPESIEIVAPANGLILARNISAGEHFDRSTEFYRIVDLSKIWIIAEVFEKEADYFRPGALARISLPGQRTAFAARVSQILPEVDPETRTLELRLEADNPRFALRPNMFVDVELAVSAPPGLSVPQDAVVDSGREQRVFVERSAGVFEPREVETGWRFGDRVQVLRGLSEGERVVSAGTFLLDAESRLKAIPSQKPPEVNHRGQPMIGNPQVATGVKVEDPACGMMIDKTRAIAEGKTLVHGSATYYFCSESCKRKFRDQPDHYMAMNP
jgi:RND family efflux transporter MFP subunit